MPPARRFPEGFIWGAATASYQIEGAVEEDGRGPSIWDVFSHTPGLVRDGDTGDVACDHYHRWAADLDLVAELGLGAYRFSIAWPRVIPDGDGAINDRGLDFYDRLVDGLLERGIRPVPTLYHWDLPQALEDRGGWPERSTADAFGRYVQAVVDRLGDRVPQWITLNEPWVSAFIGYGNGRHAPGRRDLHDALLASHHLLLAHAHAMPILRTTRSEVGVTLNVSHVVPATGGPADRYAAGVADQQVNGWFADPILRGRYPDRMATWYGSLLDGIVRDGDLEAISAPIDFVGLNYYVRTHVRAVPGEASTSDPMDALPYRAEVPDGVPTTAMGWPVEPDGLSDFLVGFSAAHPSTPILITENGSAWEDRVAADGSVADPDRIAYLESHLAAVHESMATGVDVRGYFAWSLLDNFEWAEGYGKRFGIVHVDYRTQRRTLKASGRRYAEIARQNGL